MSEDAAVPPNMALALARIEAKVDVALTHHAGRIDASESRVAALELVQRDHESRIRLQEGKPVVRPSHVVGAIGLIIPVIAIIETAIIAYLMRG